MTRYADKSFSVGGYSPAGRANFDRIFGQAEPACATCDGSGSVPAVGPGTKSRLTMPCPTCTAKEGK